MYLGRVTVFDFYAWMLMISGVLMLLVGSTLPGQTVGYRVLNVVVGLAFFGYGFYLKFLFTGGEYRIFFYAFLVPVALIVQTFKARRVLKNARQAPAAGPVPPAPPYTGPVQYTGPQDGAPQPPNA